MAQAKISMRNGRTNTRQRTSRAVLDTLNFKVPTNFKRQFKGFAVSRGISMVELLREGFAPEPDETQVMISGRLQ